MPRHVHRIPAIKLHKASGRGFVQVEGRRIYMGKFGSSGAQEAYERWVAEWLSRDRRQVVREPNGPSVSDVLSAFMVHAIAYYRSSKGEPTGEADNLKDALKPVHRLYRLTPAKDFGSVELEAVRADMIGSGLSRSTINARVNRIRRAWKWAAAKKMIPSSSYVELTTVTPLMKNRSAAREAKGIGTVGQDRIDATLPHLTRVVGGMVELQCLTGCRVNEIVSMRACDVDRTSDPWEYRPERHKNDHRENDQARVIPLGPRARAIVERFLRPDRDGYLFDPREAKAESRVNGKPYRPGRSVGKCYDRRSYAQAIARACNRAFPHPELSKVQPSKLTKRQRAELKAWRKLNRWSPLQFRHTAATRVRKDFGLEAAQAVLGHARADTTQIYAERLSELARNVARTTG